MSCEDCERLRDLQARTHRLYLEHIGNDPREGQMTKTPNGPEHELREAYDAAAAEYKGHVATAHLLRPPL
jgi:hypothetical protein